MQLIPYQFDPGTVALILEGLAELPYKRVHQPIDAIRAHGEGYLRQQTEEAQRQPEVRPADSMPQVRRLRKKAR